ncbi:glucan endo-1,3-beta-glucosidase 14 isoform X1 [Elaeis guineensis]|uniref:glucan endo-1,3-beta-D-glucosidase n=2 Tax=Elaeis guineensis var. tenera TaxID=51953 RepID=A0A6I9QDK1_ELAGV|nr:glucan endo-1,3-beta-glucosidase 14 isoform X1 [Elaeis guineensis]
MPPEQATPFLLPPSLPHMASSSTAPALVITILIIVIPCSFFLLLLLFLFSRRQLCRPFPVLHNDKKKKTKMMSGLLLFVYCCLLLVLASHGPATVQAFTGTYGINYGRIANNIPPPENVVLLLKAAKIKNVRIYDADHSVLNAFKGSGLELVVSIPNEYVIDMSVNEDRAMEWLKENVQPFLPDTHIRGIAVGNEVLGGADQGLAEALLGAIKNVYSALGRLQLTGLIEVSTPHSEAVFANSYPPSSCTFKESVFIYMKPILDFFSQTGAPFYVNAYPFLAYKNDPEHIDINYALFKPNSGVYDAKTGLHYDNMLDAQIDAAYAALEAAGYDKMEVLVSETGWASAGDENEAGATVQNARTYNFNLRKRLFKKKGTPLRPKIVVKAYCFALFNENLKPGPASERHFGLFKADGSIAYNIGFRGLKPSGASRSLLSLKDVRARGWVTSYFMVLTTCIAALLALTM